MRRRLLFAFLLCAVGASALACGTAGPTEMSPARGAASRDEVVAAFLAAVADNDAADLIALTDPVVDAQADVARLLHASGGVHVVNLSVSWRDEFGGIFIVATATGTSASGAPATFTIPISRKSGRFYLALGSTELHGSDSAISSPSPS